MISFRLIVMLRKEACLVANFLDFLTRYGIYKLVRRHTRQLCKARAGQPGRNISPHVFRHTAAVHMLEAGVEVNVIRAWLGHVGLEKTNRYAEINLRMKQ